jgi:urea transport system substrate-binding protein
MSNSLSKRLFAGMAAASLGLAVTACGGDDKTASNVEYDDTVTVGILHSLTGTMAISESTLVDTEKMAIDEINAAGGVEVDGKKYKIDYIVEDGASDWPTFAEKSKKLIDQDSVPVVFGGWTSASRKAMLPVYESKDAFLYYPIQYEAQECSNNIFYTGATPNQQSEPATKFMYEKSPAAGKPFFLVGSDYVFPRTSEHDHQIPSCTTWRHRCW